MKENAEATSLDGAVETSLAEEVTFRLRSRDREGSRLARNEEGAASRGNSMCKRLEVRKCLLCLSSRGARGPGARLTQEKSAVR